MSPPTVIYDGRQYTAVGLLARFQQVDGYSTIDALHRVIDVFEGRDECDHPAGRTEYVRPGLPFCDKCGSFI